MCEHEGLELSLLPAALMKSAFEMSRDGTSQAAHPALCAMSLKSKQTKKKNKIKPTTTLCSFILSAALLVI